jgi:protein-L-isoaspartate(D-aspartate) O-methyltransferase
VREDENRAMIRDQIVARGVRDPRVLDAMRRVPRHLFVPPELQDHAYEDRPLQIGHGQTISQPYVVAAMTEVLDVGPGSRVLEIGAGSGYQAAVLARLGAEVHSIETVPEIAVRAADVLSRMGIPGVMVHVGDGWEGLPSHAPFDRIILTAAPPEVPGALVAQLAPGGRMVLPLGDSDQVLVTLDKEEDGTLRRTDLFPVRFVPMVRRRRNP